MKTIKVTTVKMGDSSEFVTPERQEGMGMFAHCSDGQSMVPMAFFLETKSLIEAHGYEVRWVAPVQPEDSVWIPLDMSVPSPGQRVEVLAVSGGAVSCIYSGGRFRLNGFVLDVEKWRPL